MNTKKKFESKKTSLFGLLIFSAVIFILYFSSCKKGDPDSISCDTTGWVPDSVRYSNVVAPLLLLNCQGCHSNGAKQGNISLEGYANVKKYADSDQLLGAMAHLKRYKPMPQNGTKLPEADICKVKFWIDNGVKNN